MPSCPYCLSKEYSTSYMEDTNYNQKTFSYLRCKNCRVIYLEPYPLPEDYDKMYDNTYTEDVFTAPTGKYFGLFDQVLTVFNEAKSLLDYGCGNSELLQDGAEKGFLSSGVEYSPEFVEELRKRIPNFNFQTTTDFEASSEKYDVIVLNNVLEHLTNPNEVLKLIRTRLNENGVFVCLGPIEDNFTFALMFRKSIFYLRKKLSGKPSTHPPYHITFTNYQNQLEMFSKNGFKMRYYYTREDAWPFPEKVTIRPISHFVTSIVAKCSMFWSTKMNKKAGNVFTYIGQKV